MFALLHSHTFAIRVPIVNKIHRSYKMCILHTHNIFVHSLYMRRQPRIVYIICVLSMGVVSFCLCVCVHATVCARVEHKKYRTHSHSEQTKHMRKVCALRIRFYSTNTQNSHGERLCAQAVGPPHTCMIWPQKQ